jgi:NAD/NADP transhydrogenase beta subunit
LSFSFNGRSVGRLDDAANVAPGKLAQTMSNTAVIDVAVGVAVVALLVARQMRARPVREGSAARISAVLGIIGLVELSDASKGHSLGTAPVVWIVVSLLVGGGLGAARAFSTKVWRLPDGSAMSQGTVVTAVLWVVSLAAHLAMEVGIDHSTKIVGLGASSLLLYLAVTLGVQREVLRRRAGLTATGPRW